MGAIRPLPPAGLSDLTGMILLPARTGTPPGAPSSASTAPTCSLADRVLFQAGQTFAGNLRLTAEDASTASLPVVIGSFGDGRATISAGAGTGVAVENAGGITVENLLVVGAGITNNGGYGILCNNTLANATMLDHLSIENVEVSGFGKHGILVSGAPAGFRHVRVSHCVMRGNLLGGMEIAAVWTGMRAITPMPTWR